MRRLALCLWMFATAAHAQPLQPKQSEIDAWRIADRNGDGVLSKSEFKVMIRELAKTGQRTARRVQFTGAYGFAFSVADADKNGVLTPIELRRADKDFKKDPP